MLVDKTVRELINELSAESPAPGGGAYSAFNSAAAAALLNMVCKLTLNKKGYEEHTEQLKNVIEKNVFYMDNSLKLIDEDTNSFNEVIKAYRMPKTTETEKLERDNAIQNALKNATEMPLQIAKNASEILQLSTEVAKICNKNCITDCAIAGIAAYSAIIGAIFNIKINLKSIKDEEYCKCKIHETSLIGKNCKKNLELILDIVTERMN